MYKLVVQMRGPDTYRVHISTGEGWEPDPASVISLKNMLSDYPFIDGELISGGPILINTEEIALMYFEKTE